MNDDLIRRSDVYKAIDDWLAGRVPNLNIKDIPAADKPQGEWIRTGRTNIYGGIEVQCSHCKDKVMVQHLEDEWYCRHCGADMGMKGADDEDA